MSPRWEYDPNVRRGRSVISRLHVHLVFVTKYRRAVFTKELLEACEEAMRRVCEKFGATLSEFNGENNHVHLLINYPPTVEISRLVNSLKGVSSRHLRSNYPNQIKPLLWGKHLWSPSYFAASAGGAPLEIIAEYIQNQSQPETPNERGSSRP